MDILNARTVSPAPVTDRDRWVATHKRCTQVEPRSRWQEGRRLESSSCRAGLKRTLIRPRLLWRRTNIFGQGNRWAHHSRECSQNPLLRRFHWHQQIRIRHLSDNVA